MSTKSSVLAALEGSHFLLGAPFTATAGTAFTFTVTALAPYNNVASGYTGIVQFSSSDSQSVLPGLATLTSGVGTFSATLKTAGSQTFTTTDTLTSTVTGATSISVSAAVLNHFGFSTIGSASAGTPFNFTVMAEDAFGNTVTGYTGAVRFVSSDTRPQTTLPAAGNQTITAVDTTKTSIVSVSAPIHVIAAPASTFVNSVPMDAALGVSFSATVLAIDPFGNLATTYDGSVALTMTADVATLPVTATVTNGAVSFSPCMMSAGNQTITATDANITATSNPIVVGGGKHS